MASAMMNLFNSTLVTILMMLVARTNGHGRLIEPPSRSSMWRFGFKTPVNYDDNQLFCGGYDVQWNTNGGRCGICGDPYTGPRDNEAGGRFATGIIAKRYTEGQTITVSIDVTVNHGGYFEFKMCPNNNPSRPATESCLNQFILRQPNGETRWHLPAGTHVFSVQLVLPHGLTCTQCVLQWKWNTASNWGCDGSTCCKGCGSQEQFYGCSDVAISGSGSPYSASSGSRFPIVSSSASGESASIVGIGAPQSSFNQIQYGSVAGQSAISSSVQGIGAPQVGSNNVGTQCQATQFGRSTYAYADQWCQTQCRLGNCPQNYCEASCRSLSG